MEKDHNSTDPERKIFRTALSDYKIEPSEKFWNSALHGIIDKQNAMQKRRVRTWKGISFGLAAIIVVLCLHEVFMYKRMDNVEQQVAEIKNNQGKLQQQVSKQVGGANSVGSANLKNTTVASSTNEISNSVAATKNEVAISKQGKKEVTGFVNRTGIQVNNNAVAVGQHINKRTRNTYIPVTGSTVANSPHLQVSPNVSDKVVQDMSADNIDIQSAANQPGNSLAINNVAGVAQSNNTTVDKEATKSKLQDTTNASQPVTKADTAGVDAKQAINDSLALMALKETPPKSGLSLKHRTSFSAFFAPGGVNDFLRDRDNDNTDNVTVNSIKNMQSDWFAYQTGFKIGFDISNKFKLQTGLYLNTYSYNIKQSIITAQEQEDGVGYSIVTSSGVVDIPYDQPVQEGDSIKVHGSSSRGYICIPLQLNYMLLSHYKLGFYVTGGVAVDIATFSNTNISWQNTQLQEGNVNVSSIEGLAKIHLVYNLGLGISYKLGKGFEIYGEPYVQQSITAINRNTPVVTYPFFIGGALGLTYHL